MHAAADAAPGPLSALAAAIATFAARALDERRLAWAVIGEPVDAQVDAMRLDFRQSLAAELDGAHRAAIAGGHLPEQDAGVAAPAIVGALMEGLIGPLAPHAGRCRRRARSGAERDAAGAARARRGRCARPRAGGAMRAAVTT